MTDEQRTPGAQPTYEVVEVVSYTVAEVGSREVMASCSSRGDAERVAMELGRRRASASYDEGYRDGRYELNEKRSSKDQSSEVADMLAYLLRVIEHEVPAEYACEGDASGAFYLSENTRKARAMIERLVSGSACPEADFSDGYRAGYSDGAAPGARKDFDALVAWRAGRCAGPDHPALVECFCGDTPCICNPAPRTSEAPPTDAEWAAELASHGFVRVSGEAPPKRQVRADAGSIPKVTLYEDNERDVPARVTAEDWRKLAKMLLVSKAADLDLAAIRERFGLDEDRRESASTERNDTKGTDHERIESNDDAYGRGTAALGQRRTESDAAQLDGGGGNEGGRRDHRSEAQVAPGAPPHLTAGPKASTALVEDCRELVTEFRERAANDDAHGGDVNRGGAVAWSEAADDLQVVIDSYGHRAAAVPSSCPTPDGTDVFTFQEMRSYGDAVRRETIEACAKKLREVSRQIEQEEDHDWDEQCMGVERALQEVLEMALLFTSDGRPAPSGSEAGR